MLGIRLFFIGILASAVIGAGAYVMKLRSDNAILQANQIKLEESINSQKEVIENQKADFQEILKANADMNKLVNNLKDDIEALDKRFNKKERDIVMDAIVQLVEEGTSGGTATTETKERIIHSWIPIEQAGLNFNGRFALENEHDKAAFNSGLSERSKKHFEW